MGTEGLEPSRTITRQRILSPSCLPIPPRPLIRHVNILYFICLQKSNGIELYLKAAPRFELGIEDLQSTALPLGHTAKNTIVLCYNNYYN
jgi:hypothetical protein